MIRTPYSQITPQLTVSQPLINLKIVLSPELFRCACSINVRRISRRKRNHRTSDFLVVCVGALLCRRVAALLQKRKALISSSVDATSQSGWNNLLSSVLKEAAFHIIESFAW